MIEKVQNKINEIMEMAKLSSKKPRTANTNSLHPQDSLFKAICNPQEASVFLAELSAVISMSKSK